jgi:hypothetical protein
MKTKTIRTGMIAALAAIGLAGCGDPWQGGNKANPEILRVIAMDPNNLAAFDSTGSVQANAPDGAGVWQVTGLNYTNADGKPAQASLLIVQANKLLDGASIQVSPTDCTPAAGSFTFTPADPTTAIAGAPAGTTWYACYNPTSPNTDQGGSIMFYAGTDALDPSSAQSFVGGTLVTVTGSVKDHQGKSMAVHVQAQF